MKEPIVYHRLKLGVVGEFSAGKSQFVNTFLRMTDLKTDIRPETDSIQIITSSIARCFEEELTIDHITLIKEHISLRMGLEVWDTPGLNAEDPKHERLALTAMERVDQLIFVSRSQDGLIPRTTLKSLQHASTLSQRRRIPPPLLILTYFDRLADSVDDEEEIEELLEIIQEQSPSGIQVFCLNAKDLSQFDGPKLLQHFSNQVYAHAIKHLVDEFTQLESHWLRSKILMGEMVSEYIPSYLLTNEYRHYTQEWAQFCDKERALIQKWTAISSSFESITNVFPLRRDGFVAVQKRFTIGIFCVQRSVLQQVFDFFEIKLRSEQVLLPCTVKHAEGKKKLIRGPTTRVKQYASDTCLMQLGVVFEIYDTALPNTERFDLLLFATSCKTFEDQVDIQSQWAKTHTTSTTTCAGIIFDFPETSEDYERLYEQNYAKFRIDYKNRTWKEQLSPQPFVYCFNAQHTFHEDLFCQRLETKLSRYVRAHMLNDYERLPTHWLKNKIALGEEWQDLLPNKMWSVDVLKYAEQWECHCQEALRKRTSRTKRILLLACYLHWYSAIVSWRSSYKMLKKSWVGRRKRTSESVSKWFENSIKWSRDLMKTTADRLNEP